LGFCNYTKDFLGISLCLQVFVPRKTMPLSTVSAKGALNRLRLGNERYISGKQALLELTGSQRRKEKLIGQDPFAILLGCSDSRVPLEVIFDQGLGDLFVVRVGGNVVTSSQIGSIEFAAAKFGTPLVVVLGHSNCGAVIAALEEFQKPSGKLTPGLKNLLERIQPSVAAVLSENEPSDPTAKLHEMVKANVQASVGRLRQESSLLAKEEVDGGMKIVGAEYCLETGKVEFHNALSDG
jgi:carbonic anhydrase